MPRRFCGLVLVVVATSCASGAPPKNVSAPAVRASVEHHFVAGGFIPVLREDAVMGPSTALITIVAFFDYETLPNLPPWGANARRIVDQIMRDYDGGVRLVAKHDPMAHHPHALQAAIASQIVLENLGSKWFFSFTKRVIDNEYGTLDSFLEMAATELGVPLDVYRKALLDPRHHKKIEGDVALVRQIGGDLAPPLFAINGVIANGARSHLWFSGVINAEIGPARALFDAGLSPAQVYERRVAENLAHPPKHHHHPDDEPIRTQLTRATRPGQPSVVVVD